MKIIGEKINGTRKAVAAAVTGRDTAAVQRLATAQAEAGADWLDVNAGTSPATEPEDLAWLVETVQAVTDVPLCLDSANPDALRRALAAVDRTPMINSINGEDERLEQILPLVAEHGCEVIALALGGTRMPESAQERMDVVHLVIDRTRRAGVPDDKVYVDPLLMTVATDVQAGRTTLETIRQIREAYPEVHLTLGLSNVSFGLPARSHVNRTFCTLAMAEGLDSAIMDPTDRGLVAAIVATDLVLGRDRHCLAWTRAARKGRFDPAPAQDSAPTQAPLATPAPTTTP